MLINIIILPLDPLIWPTYAEITQTVAQKNWAATRRILRRISLLAGSLVLAVGLGLALTGWLLLPLFYGPQAAPAYPILLILLAGYGFASVFQWNRPLLLALGKPGVPVLVSLLTGLLELDVDVHPRPGCRLHAPALGHLLRLLHPLHRNYRLAWLALPPRRLTPAHPSAFFILYSSFFILHSAFCILHSAFSYEDYRHLRLAHSFQSRQQPASAQGLFTRWRKTVTKSPCLCRPGMPRAAGTRPPGWNSPPSTACGGIPDRVPARRLAPLVLLRRRVARAAGAARFALRLAAAIRRAGAGP